MSITTWVVLGCVLGYIKFPGPIGRGIPWGPWGPTGPAGPWYPLSPWGLWGPGSPGSPDPLPPGGPGGPPPPGCPGGPPPPPPLGCHSGPPPPPGGPGGLLALLQSGASHFWVHVVVLLLQFVLPGGNLIGCIHDMSRLPGR